jgi:hypothetical protein
LLEYEHYGSVSIDVIKRVREVFPWTFGFNSSALFSTCIIHVVLCSYLLCVYLSMLHGFLFSFTHSFSISMLGH